MKRGWAWMIAAMLLCGCTQSSTEQSTQPAQSVQTFKLSTSARSVEDVSTILENSSWLVEQEDPSIIPMWSSNLPVSFLQGQASESQILFAGWFDNELKAHQAYTALMPDDESAIHTQDGSNYQQVTVNLENNGGFWTFRQIGALTMGIWYNDPVLQQPSFEILNQFQA